MADKSSAGDAENKGFFGIYTRCKEFVSNLFLEHTLSVLVILFTIVGILIIYHIDQKQGELIQSLIQQEEAYYAGKAAGFSSKTIVPQLKATDIVFESTSSMLQQTFILLLILMAGFLSVIGYVLRSLRKSKQKISQYAKNVEKMNVELQNEVGKRAKLNGELKVLNKELKHTALYDSLTGLPNRFLFEDRLQTEIANASRYHGRFAVMFIDLDGFKIINDSLGHEVGDELLKSVAKRVKKLVRSSDTFARLGGDEFTVIASRVAYDGRLTQNRKQVEKNTANTVADSTDIAERIVNALAEPFVINKRKLYISASIGITLYPDDAQDMKTLLKNADVAMYQVKEMGRNGYQFYRSSMKNVSKRQLMLKSGLHTAISGGDLYLVYQPQIDINKHIMFGVEALVRWNHKELGDILPDEFIPLAEQTGTIVELGWWVIKEACNQFVIWKNKGMKLRNVSINISPLQIASPEYISRVKKIIRDSGLSYSDVVLEITENSLVEHSSEAIQELAKIKGLGLRFAIDDFGTGYSSMQYLKLLPLDSLKIDKSFVSNITESDADKAIISAMVAIGKSLGLSIVAEGVETKDQLQSLVDLNCHKIQGHIFSPALGCEDLESYFNSKSSEDFKNI